MGSLAVFVSFCKLRWRRKRRECIKTKTREEVNERDIVRCNVRFFLLFGTLHLLISLCFSAYLFIQNGLPKTIPSFVVLKERRGQRVSKLKIECVNITEIHIWTQIFFSSSNIYIYIDNLHESSSNALDSLVNALSSLQLFGLQDKTAITSRWPRAHRVRVLSRQHTRGRLEAAKLFF